MTTNIIRQRGVVLDRVTLTPLTGARVDAWDADGQIEHVVARALTNARGEFEMRMTVDEIAALFGERQVNLVFRVVFSSVVVADTQEVVRWLPNREQPFTKIYADTESSVAAGGDTFVVTGRIIEDGSGSPSQVDIKVLDVRMDGDVLLAQENDITMPSHYSVTFNASAISAGKRLPDLKVQVFESGRDLLNESEIRFQAGPATIIDIAVNPALTAVSSEQEDTMTAVAAVLGTANPRDLSDVQIDQVAQSAEVLPARVRATAKADAIAASFSGAIAQEALYGLQRQAMPETRPGLLSIRRVELRAALERAAGAGQISLSPAQISTELTNLRDEAVAAAQAGSNGFGALLTQAGLSPTDRTTLLQAYVAHEGTPEEFWSSLSLGASAKEAAQTYLRVGAVVRYHVPLLQALTEEGGWESFEELAAFDEAWWTDVMLNHGVVLPAGLAGTSDEERSANWAKLIVRTMASVVPTRYLATRVDGQRETFLDNNPSFDFRKHRVAIYFATESPNLSGISDVEALKSDLARTERLIKLTPRAEQVTALEAAGFTSARSIARYGRQRFLDDHAGTLDGAKAAAVIYDQAVRQAHKAAHLFAKLNPAINGPWMPFLANLDAPPTAGTSPLSGGASSELETYFGHPALCVCARCAAIHGPAANLVALLVWLDRFATLATKTGGSATARDLLLGAAGLSVPARRPDLGFLELTCDNVDGVLPYIDVVNEILEWRVAGVTPNAAIGTGGTIEDRLGAPEILDEEAFVLAYAKLAGGHAQSVVYPFVLPWSLWLEQTRIHLRHLGVERHALMEVLQLPGEPSAPTNSAIAIERFGIHPVAWGIVAEGTAGSLTPDHFWGMGANGGWVTDLQNAAIFIERAKIATYDELLELLDTSMVHAPILAFPSEPTLSPHPATVRCDLSQVSIVGIDVGNEQAFFEWVQRVVRLRHALGWRFADIDKLFRLASDPLDPPTIDFDLLIAAARGADQLEKELAIPRAEALAFWGHLDDHPMPQSGLPTVVDRLFRARSAGPLLGGELPSPLSGAISDHAHVIRAGLRIDAEAFALLTNVDSAGALFLAPPVASNVLDPSNLTTLFRYARLSRALELHVAELMVFVALSATDPFGTAAGPRELVREIRALSAAGLSADLVHYLVRHVERPRRGVPSRAAEIEKHAAAVTSATEIARAATKAPAKVVMDELRDELYAALDALADPGVDPDVRAARLAGDIDFVLAIVDDLTIEPVDASEHRARLEAIFGGVLDDPAPIAQFLVPEHPKDLPSCRVWCDDSDPYAGATWPNQVSGGPSVSQATPGSRPEGETGPFGGLRFDGVDDYLDVALSHSSERHTFAVAASPEISTEARALLDVPGEFLCAAQTPTAGQVGYGYGSPPTWQDVGGLAWGMQALLFRLDGGAAESGYVYRNGEPIATAARPFDDGLTFVNARLGGSTVTGVEPFLGVIHAFGIFDAALGVTELARVNGFLALLQQRRQDRIAFVYRALRDVVHRREVASAVKKRASERLAISEAMGAHILVRLNAVDTPEDDATSLLDNLRPPSVGGHRFPDPGASSEERVRALTRFSKVALLADELSLTLADLDWLLVRSEEGWLDLNTLPVETSDLALARAHYAALLRLVDVHSLAHHFVDGRAGMYDLSARADTAPSDAELMAAVAAQTRWDAADLLELHARFHGDVTPYVDLTGFLRLAPAAEALRKLGVSAATALGWLVPAEGATPAQATARQVLEAARAKHAAEQWNAIAPALRDPLRDGQREALVAHLIQAEGLAGAEALYDELLIDVEMSACQKISRIRAALNSAQLFVHRAMLGLEPSWIPDKDARAQWEWRKIFTLWEANRKVFLYPEDFIEPELRDDKTPLFSQLEADLRQGDLTDDRIERAYYRYLRGLEEIAQLEPVGIFHEQQAATPEHPSVDALHVFAQTPGGAPRALYQRQFVDGTYWTPWEPVPLEASARCFLPVVRNGRKQLFWLEASERFDAGDKPEGGAEPKDMPVRLRVAASSFDGFEWSKPQIIDLGDAPSAEEAARTFLSYSASLDDSADMLVAQNERVVSTDESSYELLRVTQLEVGACSGALEPSSRIPPADFTDPIPDRTRVRFGAFEQAEPYRLYGLSGSTNLFLWTPGTTLSRSDMTVWHHEGSKLEVPLGSFFTRAADHWLFVQRSPLPSANPLDYVAPPAPDLFNTEVIEAKHVAEAAFSSYAARVTPKRIALMGLDDEVAFAHIEATVSPTAPLQYPLGVQSARGHPPARPRGHSRLSPPEARAAAGARGSVLRCTHAGGWSGRGQVSQRSVRLRARRRLQ